MVWTKTLSTICVDWDVEYQEIARYRRSAHRSERDSNHLTLLLPVRNVVLERQHFEPGKGA